MTKKCCYIDKKEEEEEDGIFICFIFIILRAHLLNILFRLNIAFLIVKS
jgi:hypothetical protein